MKQQDRAFLYYVLSKFANIVDKGREHVKAVNKAIYMFYKDKAEKLYQEGLALSEKLPEGKEKNKYNAFLASLSAFSHKLKLYSGVELQAVLEKLSLVNEYTTIIASNAKKDIQYAFRQVLDLYKHVYAALYDYYALAQDSLINIAEHLHFIHSRADNLSNIVSTEEIRTYLTKLKKDLSFEVWEKLWRDRVIEPMKELGELKAELVKHLGPDVEQELEP